MEGTKLKKEDAFYYLNKLLDDEGTEFISGLIENQKHSDSIIVRNKNFTFAILLLANADDNFLVIRENKNKTCIFSYQELCQFNLSSEELLSITEKMRVLSEIEDKVLEEDFLSEIQKMKEQETFISY